MDAVLKMTLGAYCQDNEKKFLSLSHLLSLQFCQSFAFYGLRAAFVLYLTQELAMRDEEALKFYGNFMGFLYFSPLIGGILIDRFWAVETSMLWGVSSTVVGMFFMAMGSQEILYLGAALVVVGQGFFKPVVPFLMDDSRYKSNYNRESSFTLYYIMINVGGTLSPLLCGLIRIWYGWVASFVLMIVIALVGLYLVISIRLKCESKKLEKVNLFLALGGLVMGITVLYLLLKSPDVIDRLVVLSLPVIGGYFLYLHGKSDDKLKLAVVFLSLTMLVFFVSLFEQSGGSMALFLERHVNRSLLTECTIPTVAFQSLNPLLVILFGSIASYVWSRTDRHSGEFSALLRLALGFFLTMIGFYILWLCSGQDISLEKVNGWWVVLAIALQTLGELCIVPLTLSLITHLSPSQVKGTAIGLWALSIAYGHYLASLISRLVHHTSPQPFDSFVTFKSIFLLSCQISLLCVCFLFLVKIIFKFWGSEQGRTIFKDTKFKI